MGDSTAQPSVQCAECGRPMILRNSRFGKFYGCSGWPDCTGTHGAHPDGRPLGKPATAETKQARIRAHAAFDRLWKDGGMSRREAYSWMRRAMGVPGRECHISMFDLSQCEALVRLVEGEEPTASHSEGSGGNDGE